MQWRIKVMVGAEHVGDLFREPADIPHQGDTLEFPCRGYGDKVLKVIERRWNLGIGNMTLFCLFH
jgi:hypothetical protein